MTAKCLICGRPLSNPASVAAGVGAICGGRGYESRIRGRHGSFIGGWADVEAFQIVNHPCYSCKFFRFPTKGNEVRTATGWNVTFYVDGIPVTKEFDPMAIGGYCSKIAESVDGNLIREATACRGRFYQERSPRNVPKTGLLRTGEEELLFML